MKAVGCAVLVVVLAVGGFFGLAAWLVVRGDDQSGLTQRVEATVLDPREVGTGTGSGYRFAYAYEVDGQWYGYDRYVVNERVWNPGDPISVCVDPDDPHRHVVSLVRPCGQERTDGNFVKEATPRPAPESRDQPAARQP